MLSRLRANIGFVTSYVSPLLSRPGAATVVSDTLVDAHGVAWHYGNPLTEQGLSTPLVDRSHRQVISVSGPDAAAYVNSLLSQKLDDVSAGYSGAALDLDAQGRILHHADVCVADGTFFFDLPSQQAESFAQYLERMKFWSDVTIERTDLAIVTVMGEVSSLPEHVFARRVSWPHRARLDIAVPRDDLVATMEHLEAAGGQLMGLMGFTAERVRALEPEVGADLDSKSIPHESQYLLDHSVHLNKGCYRGQETVSRVHNLGRSPRLLVVLHLDGSAPTRPNCSDPITSAGRVVGRIGTIIDDYELGPIALGLVKRSALDGQLMCGDTALAVDDASMPAAAPEPPGRAAINRLRGDH